jgi:hypothetical protein
VRKELLNSIFELSRRTWGNNRYCQFSSISISRPAELVVNIGYPVLPQGSKNSEADPVLRHIPIRMARQDEEHY